MAVADPKPQRADARRNRARIVTAARAVFAEQGREAQMDDVARRAKVGMGTVYRHFPTKEALIEALAADKFEYLAAQARAALELDDPWTGFEQFAWRAAEKVARDRALYEVFASQSCVVERAAQSREDLTRCVTALMTRAQASGALRADVHPGDMGMIMCGVGGAMQACAHVGDDWKRFFQLVMDGLRA